MLTDLQKAELYLKNKDMTFKHKSEKSGISINTLKKYITLPQRLKKHLGLMSLGWLGFMTMKLKKRNWKASILKM